MLPAEPVSPSPNATAFETFLGIRVELPGGKTFVARQPLLFLDALRWMELLELHHKGGEYSETLALIVHDLRTKLDVEDLSVLNDLTLGEVHDYVLSSFFSHRRSLPGWMVQLLEQQRPRPATPPGSPT